VWRVVLVGCLLTGPVGAEPEERRGPARWQQATSAPSLVRVWGIGAELYGVGPSGTHRSIDGGATWSAVEQGSANGIWGSSLADVWVVRARTIHHSMDGAGEHWAARTLPVSFGTTLEGIWGIDRERYVFGADRSEGRGVILHSRDGGASWQREAVDIERVAGMWGTAKDRYAVGARGAILHSSGDGSWRTVRTGTGSLEGIWGTEHAIYAVGTGGTILSSTDGKTWTPRTSGVKYTLSSIVGLSGRELFVGSVDGAPLRSTDGAAWKPITALVPRGHVWASSREHMVVASSEVHFVGDSLGEPIVAPVVPDDLKPLITRFAQYPAARDLIAIAAHRLGSRVPLSPWLTRPGLPRFRITSIKNCSSLLDALTRDPAFTYPGTEIALELTCAKPCSATNPRPTVTQHAKILHAGAVKSSVEVHYEAQPDLCAANDPEATIAHEAVMARHASQLGTELITSLADATSEAAKIDAYARYLIDGGITHTITLAQLLDRPVTWRGFFWNDPVASSTAQPAAKQAVCSSPPPPGAEEKADEAFNQGQYAQASRYFQKLLPCRPRVLQKAYLAACRAREFPLAKKLFQQIGNNNYAVICMKEGFDPRKP
jgi:photosystem II stability/assembly factor-like uncharacterized protein